MKYLYLLPLLIHVLAFSDQPHKYYVSNTLIEHDVISGNLEITVKLFTDDMERSLTDTTMHRLFLGEVRELPYAADSLKSYVLNHFSLTVNLRPASVHYLGREYVNDMVYCYLEVASVPDFQSIEVHNRLLCETFPGQKNVVELSAAGWKQTEICDCTRQQISFRK